MTIPTLSQVSSKYGAPMGRPITTDDFQGEHVLAIYALPMVDGAYDAGGAYFGSGTSDGTSIYRAVTEDGNTESFVRAGTLDQAKARVLEVFPNATFDKAEADLLEFFHHYLIAALWSTNDESTSDGGEPLDANYSAADIDPDSLEFLKADCRKFLGENHELLKAEVPTFRTWERILQRAGHDFWLTRAGSGAGFWDGDWPVSGDALTEACKAYREIYLEVGDDKKIYAQ